MSHSLFDKKTIVAGLAREALLKEIELTPKPGLVDKNNSGSHDDMDIITYYRSISAINPFFSSFVNAGEKYFDDPQKCFLALRSIGKNCEKAMFDVTYGVNTHKGAIFSFAIVLGAFGALMAKSSHINSQTFQKEIKLICKDLVQNDFKEEKYLKTTGGKFYTKFNHGGIRQEAQNGFPVIFQKALPFFLTCRDTEDEALKRTLLFLMSTLNDTTIWKRGGLESLKWVKKTSKSFLHVRSFELDTILIDLDIAFMSKNLSAGASADMLALTWLVDKLIKISY